jgi:hypothetical protein
MSVLRGFAIICSGLLSCTGAIALGGWISLYHQPTGIFMVARDANWKPVIKVANDKLFDLKVESGVVPPPVI